MVTSVTVGPIVTSDFSQFFWSNGESDETRLQRDIDERTSKCMRDRGFSYPTPDSSADLDTSEAGEGRDARSYGVMDQLMGAHQSSAPSNSSLNDYMAALSVDGQGRFLEALNGGSSSIGCVQIASDAVRSEMPRFDPLYADVLDDYYSALNSDGEILRLTAEWTTCIEQRTQLLSSTASTLKLARNNIRLVVFVDLATRIGRSARWVTMDEAEKVDLGGLPQPVDMEVDSSLVGYLVWGPPARLSADEIDRAAEREAELWSVDDACWKEVGGDERVRELQAEAMERVALLLVS